MVNTQPSKKTQARMEIMLHQQGGKQTAALWTEFLRTRKFSDIDQAWDNFEEWLHGTMENVMKLVGKLK